MSANRDPQSAALSLERGTQALLSLSSLGSPIGSLPPDARRNLIVVASETPETVADQLSTAGTDLDTVAHVPISGAETDYDGPMWTCDPLVPDDLTGLSMRLSRAFEALEGSGTLLVETLNVFLLYAAQSRVIRFLDHLTGLAADHDITGIYAVERGTVDAETYDQLRLRVDTEIDHT